MEKKEFVLSFIDKIKNNQFDELYKYFTSRTKIVFLDNGKEMNVSEFLSYLDETFRGEELTLGRVMDSAVAVKTEIKSPKFAYESMIFEVKNRRFERIEMFSLA